MLNDSEFFVTVCAVETYGGSFYRALGVALRHADRTNRERILAAFPEIAQKYGPGTSLYIQTENSNV